MNKALSLALSFLGDRKFYIGPNFILRSNGKHMTISNEQTEKVTVLSDYQSKIVAQAMVYLVQSGAETKDEKLG